MIADDLFAGAGGWDLAAEALGIHARGIENMPAARATRDAAGLTTIHDDVWTFADVLDAMLRSDDPEVFMAALQIASPPCQTFSAAGKGSGRKALDDVLSIIPSIPWMTLTDLRDMANELGDERTALVLTPLWYATHYPYRALAWEQVPQVLPVWEACADTLRYLGWNVWTGKLYSEQYGVPQTRIRAFLLASRDHEVAPPTPTHSRYYSRTPEKLDPGVQKWVSMAEALGWHPTDRMVSNYGTGGNAQNRGVRTGDQPAPTVTSKIDRNIVVRTVDASAPTVTGASGRWQFMVAAGATGAGTPRSADHPAPTMTTKGTAYWLKSREDYIGPKPIPGETAADCDWVHDRPSPTIVGTFAPDVVAKPGYRKAGDPPRQKTPGSVRITLGEALVLQSCPADLPVNGGPKDAQGPKFLQVGNMVPPLMALHALAAATGLAIPTDTAEENVA